MPEGHSVHRIARQFALHFVGRVVAASSPQGRFAAGAREIDGATMIAAKAVGKQMFLQFDNGLWLRVHLGMYGAWDFTGDVTADAVPEPVEGPTLPEPVEGRAVPELVEGRAVPGSVPEPVEGRAAPTVIGAFEDSLRSIGAPRRTRLRMAESENLQAPVDRFPPEPIGAVRVRLLTDATCADLRGPTACEVLHADEVQAVLDRLGPDPLVDTGRKAEDRFVETVRRKPTPIGLLLMDQSVVAGIGNVYRAELLFRARVNPHTPGRALAEETVRALWRDWAKLLKIGVQTGQMMTMDGLRGNARAAALANRADRHWVYHREGKPCRVCSTPIVKEIAATRALYWCPQCQA